MAPFSIKNEPATRTEPSKVLTMVIAAIGGILIILTAVILLFTQNVPTAVK